MKKTIDHKESARGLIAITKTTDAPHAEGTFHWEKVSPGKFALKGPLPKEQAESLLASITDIATKVIEREGHDPEKWSELLHGEVISPGHCAARILLEAEKVARLLGRLESEYVPNERRRHIPKRKRPRKNVPKRLQRLAFEAVRAALVTAFEMQMLAVVENEVAIDSGMKSAVGARAGGRAKSTLDRDQRLVSELLAHPLWAKAKPKERAKLKKEMADREGMKIDTFRDALTRGGLK